MIKYWLKVIELPMEKVKGQIFHSVYGKEYKILDIAKTVISVVGSESKLIEGRYEPGEMVDGKPVREWTTSTKDDYLGVHPCVDLEEGIRRTIPYIKEVMGI